MTRTVLLKRAKTTARYLFIVLGYVSAMVISFVVGYFLGGVLL